MLWVYPSWALSSVTQEGNFEMETTAKVLVVDDEKPLADLISEWVKEKWVCQTVFAGQDAIDAVDDTFDIVLLDRSMPEMSGDEVVKTIRKNQYRGQVMMVSAVQPDFDIIGLPIDDYLQKPVDRFELQEKIEQLIHRRSYQPEIQKYFTYAAKIRVLESEKYPVELAENEEYLILKSRADELRQEVNATLGKRTKHVQELVDIEAAD